MSTAAILVHSLPTDQQTIEVELEALLPRNSSAPVLAAMRYAVLAKGQRLRPILAMRTARLLSSQSELTLRAAAAVEMLHCASLIVDDLPCMDNEAVRRDRPSVHIAFGEANAVLAAFGLVALAARVVVEGGPEHLSSRLKFQRKLLATLDCNCLIAGQSLDLLLQGKKRDSHRTQLTELKTVPLFQLAVEAGTMLSPAREERALLRGFAREFGVSYQMLDDYLDGEQVSREEVEDQFTRARQTLVPLGSRAHVLEEMLNYLNAKAWEDDPRHR